MKIDRRIRKSKQALKTALIELINVKEFRHITITDIVAQADVNRGTFYKHYSVKEELMQEMINDTINELVASYRKPYEEATILDVTTMNASAIAIFEHIIAHAHFYKTALNPRVLPGFYQQLCTTLEQLQYSDLQRVDEAANDVDYRLFVSYATHALLGMIVHWSQTNFSHTPQYMAEQLIKIIQRPIATQYEVKV